MVTAETDQRLSEFLAKQIRARARHCWENSAQAVSLLGPYARYVEGWVVVNPGNPVALEHGWCETADGSIVDPTYTPRVTPAIPPLAYAPGLRFTAEQAHTALAEGHLPIAWMFTDPVYERSFAAAWRAAWLHDGEPAMTPGRVVHCRRDPFDAFIGRPSPWQNPFRIGIDGDAEGVVAKYRNWVIRPPHMLSKVRQLRGKTLGCVCAPGPCHGDVLVELANPPPDLFPAPSERPDYRPVALAP
jgi:hypothetical protein